MKFSEIIDQAVAMIHTRGRISYRALQREFELDDQDLDDLKEELLFSFPQVKDEEDRGLVWVGAAPVPSTESSVPSFPQSPTPNLQPPASYTPAHLAERIRAEHAAMEARGSADGERKTITALFADLKGSTALIEGLDPEEARSILDPTLQLMMDAVHRYEGYVAQALGDGIFALFGAPIAHEDHPQRALYAALRMQEVMRGYADKLREKGYPPILMRVGINTGEVVVRSIRKDDLHADYVPVGHSTNLAARMEQLAAPGSILVTDYTYKLTDGYFAFKDLGKTQVKGVEEPLNVYEVLGAGPLRTRFQVTARRGLTRFVGRQSEMEQLRNALTQAKAGHGQIVGVMGEPGLGKSRLFYEFKLLSLPGCLVLEAYSVSHGKASPYLPLIELLKNYFQIEPTDDERLRKEKVTGRVLTLDRSLEDTLPYFFSLLGIEDSQSSLQQMDAQIRRRRTFEALKNLFLRESLNQPLILIFEDLHWIDTETQGFLDVLSESVASAKILLLVNYRPEYRPEWGQKTYYTQLRLAPFGRAEAEEFLDALLGTAVGATGRSPLHDLKRVILEKTEGTPFFMEEIVQDLMEQGVLVRTDVGVTLASPSEGRVCPAPTDLHIPTTVQGVLAARIDRLAPEEKTLLQQLSIVGRQFPASLVKQVVQQPEDELYRWLGSLQAKEFLYEQPAFPEVEYLFKHALTQEVAYGTVLQERRKVLHERTGQAIEALYKDTLEDHYSELARHYQLSGNAKKAVEYLHLTGQQAVQRSANEEAITHLTAALELLLTLPDTDGRRQQELAFRLTLGVPLLATQGFASPAVGDTYTRAYELCQRIGENAQLFSVLAGLWFFYYVRAEYKTACELGEQLLRLAQRTQDATLLIEAYARLGTSLTHQGALVMSRQYAEQGIALYDALRYRSPAFLTGQDPFVTCLCGAAWVLWHLGYPDQALKRVEEALTVAEKVSHALSRAFALDMAAVLHHYRREASMVQARAEAAIAISTEQGFSNLGAWGTYMRGWAQAEQGRAVEGLAQIRDGVSVYRAGGAEMARPYQLALLAEACQRAEQITDGLTVLTEALEAVEKNNEHEYEAELYRLKGELTLQQFNVQGSKFQATDPRSPVPDAQGETEACFLKAIDIARQQHAKSWELRAATSLARLWKQQGKTTEARELLAPVYNWFTEGFDTADLKDAKMLLERLG